MAKSRKDNKGRALWKGETQRKDNTYAYTYTDPYSKKRRFVYAPDLKTLRKKEDELKRDQLDGLDTYAAGNATLNDTFDRYIASRYDLRESSRINYIRAYNYHVRDNIGTRKIVDIHYSDVRMFYLHLMRDSNLQINSVKSMHTILHPTFQLAVRDGIIRSNPSDGVITDVAKSGSKPEPKHALTVEQQKAFMGYVAGDMRYSWLLPLFTFLLGTGCRIGEALGIRWVDLDFERCLISINHTLETCKTKIHNDEKGKTVRRIFLPKTSAGIRTIPMLDEVRDALVSLREKQEKLGVEGPVIDGMQGFVFLTPRMNVPLNGNVNGSIIEIVRDYNVKEEAAAKEEGREPVFLPHISCHTFRHTFCTRLCEQETNIKVIQAVMGHADIQTTMNVYAEATEAKKKEEFEELSRNYKIF